MQLYAIAVRAVVAYVFLLIVVRISGKRSVKQGTPMDFVVALIVGDMIDDLLWAEVPASQFVVGVGALFLMHLAVEMGTFSNRALARLIEGEQAPVVHDGSLDRVGMRQERLNEQEVMAQLRQQGIDDMREVASADVELSGQVSVLQHQWAREAQKKDVEKVKKAAS